MAKFLGDTPFIELLPESLKQDEGLSQISKALDNVFHTSVQAIPALLIMARLMSEKGSQLCPALARIADFAHKEGLPSLPILSEEMLEHLAWQYHVDNFDIAQSYEAKLEMIRNSISIYKKKGTLWAVVTALKSALENVEVDIQEWFQYQGQPYHFKVCITFFGQTLLGSAQTKALRLIEDTKSKRSHCEGVSIAIGSYGQVKVGIVTAFASTISIEPELITELSTKANVFQIAMVQHTQNHIIIMSE